MKFTKFTFSLAKQAVGRAPQIIEVRVGNFQDAEHTVMRTKTLFQGLDCALFDRLSGDLQDA